MKKYSLAIMAAVFAVSTALAFTPDVIWYFDGDSTSATARTTPSNYDRTVVGCSSSQNNLCSIVAPDNNGEPSISGQLQTDLNNGGLAKPNYSNPDIVGKN